MSDRSEAIERAAIDLSTAVDGSEWLCRNGERVEFRGYEHSDLNPYHYKFALHCDDGDTLLLVYTRDGKYNIHGKAHSRDIVSALPAGTDLAADDFLSRRSAPAAIKRLRDVPVSGDVQIVINDYECLAAEVERLRTALRKVATQRLRDEIEYGNGEFPDAEEFAEAYDDIIKDARAALEGTK